MIKIKQIINFILNNSGIVFLTMIYLACLLRIVFFIKTMSNNMSNKKERNRKIHNLIGMPLTLTIVLVCCQINKTYILPLLKINSVIFFSWITILSNAIIGLILAWIYLNVYIQPRIPTMEDNLLKTTGIDQPYNILIGKTNYGKARKLETKANPEETLKKRDATNSDLIIYGDIGTGKTTYIKKEINEVLKHTDDDVIVFCDELYEYEEFQNIDKVTIEDIENLEKYIDLLCKYHAQRLWVYFDFNQCSEEIIELIKQLMKRARKYKTIITVALYSKCSFSSLCLAERDFIHLDLENRKQKEEMKGECNENE